MYRNLIYSFVEFLAAPSAMLEGIDTAALLICEINPNFSSEGNLELNLYVETTKSIDFCQTFKSLCVLIYSIYLHLLLLSYILFISLITHNSTLFTLHSSPSSYSYHRTTEAGHQ